jgi:hypothetical protein
VTPNAKPPACHPEERSDEGSALMNAALMNAALMNAALMNAALMNVVLNNVTQEQILRCAQDDRKGELRMTGVA